MAEKGTGLNQSMINRKRRASSPCEAEASWISQPKKNVARESKSNPFLQRPKGGDEDHIDDEEEENDPISLDDNNKLEDSNVQEQPPYYRDAPIFNDSSILQDHNEKVEDVKVHCEYHPTDNSISEDINKEEDAPASPEPNNKLEGSQVHELPPDKRILAIQLQSLGKLSFAISLRAGRDNKLREGEPSWVRPPRKNVALRSRTSNRPSKRECVNQSGIKSLNPRGTESDLRSSLLKIKRCREILTRARSSRNIPLTDLETLKAWLDIFITRRENDGVVTVDDDDKGEDEVQEEPPHFSNGPSDDSVSADDKKEKTNPASTDNSIHEDHDDEQEASVVQEQPPHDRDAQVSDDGSISKDHIDEEDYEILEQPPQYVNNPIDNLISEDNKKEKGGATSSSDDSVSVVGDDKVKDSEVEKKPTHNGDAPVSDAISEDHNEEEETDVMKQP